jgi:hypothetical protein
MEDELTRTLLACASEASVFQHPTTKSVLCILFKIASTITYLFAGGKSLVARWLLSVT